MNFDVLSCAIFYCYIYPQNANFVQLFKIRNDMTILEKTEFVRMKDECGVTIIIKYDKLK